MINIAIIGTGYVGLTTGIGLATLGHSVICVDTDKSKINLLNNRKIPIYEPDLLELLDENIKKSSIQFTSNIKLALENTHIIFLAVGTPDNADGSVNLEYIYNAIDDILENLTKDIFIVIKSTVTVGTNLKIQEICNKNSKYKINIISNPEFLREGFAVYDFFNPSRIIVGTYDLKAKNIMNEIYSKFIEENIPIIYTDPISAELTKYAANGFLAMKVAFINEISDLCEYYGGDVEQVSYMMGLDDRIGERFLKVGPGFGGYCFPKDSLALANISKDANIKDTIIERVISSNERRKKRMVNKILEILEGKAKIVTCLGASFKANTDDIRKSPAIFIIEELVRNNFTINLYDPQAMENTKKLLGDKINYSSNIKDACKNSGAIIILTEWQEFKEFDYSKIKDDLNNNIIIDLRNILDKGEIREQNFKYYSLGERY